MKNDVFATRMLRTALPGFMFLLFFCLLLSFFTIQAEASNIDTSLSEDINFDLYDILYDGLSDCKEEISLSGHYSEVQLQKTFRYLMLEEPDLFYVSLQYSYSQNQDTLTVTSFIPQYRFETAELPAKKADFEERIDAIVKQVNPLWSDNEKIMFFHEYICLHYTYDDSLQIGDAYTMLCTGEGVCQAYTLLFDKLLSKVGILSHNASSTEINHVWNTVRVGESWYHIDVTWNDCLDDYAEPGYVSHYYYLLSTDALLVLDGDRSDLVSASVCDDSTFDNAALHKVNSAIVFCKDGFYGIHYSSNLSALCRLSLSDGSVSAVASLPNSWNATLTTGYNAAFSSLIEYNGVLLYNTPSAVCFYNPSSNTEEILQNASTIQGYLYGFTLSGDTVSYTHRRAPDEVGTSPATVDASSLEVTVTYKVQSTVYTTQTYLKGDLLSLVTVPFTFKETGDTLTVTDWLGAENGSAVTNDLTVRAVIGAAETFLIKWNIDGTVYDDEYVLGEMPQCRNDTSKASDSEYDYTFDGFTPEIVAVTGAATYTAIYTKERNYFIVTYIAENQQATERYGKGETPVLPLSAPEKPTSDQYAYTFLHWELTETAENGDLTYTAVYKPTKIYSYSASYFITVIDGFTLPQSVSSAFSALKALDRIASSVNPDVEGVAQAQAAYAGFVSQYNEKIASENDEQQKSVVLVFDFLDVALPDVCTLSLPIDTEPMLFAQPTFILSFSDVFFKKLFLL